MNEEWKKYALIGSKYLLFYCLVFSSIIIFLMFYLKILEPSLSTKNVVVNEFTKNIVKTLDKSCYYGNVYDHDACLIDKISKVSLDKLTIEDNLLDQILYLNNNPEYTFKYGGDCENMAQLFCSLYYSANFYTIKEKECYIVKVNVDGYGHICVMFKYLSNNYKLLNCLDFDYIEYIKKAEPKVVLK